MSTSDAPSVTNHLAAAEPTDRVDKNLLYPPHEAVASKYRRSYKEIEKYCVFIAGSWFAAGPRGGNLEHNPEHTNPTKTPRERRKGPDVNHLSRSS